MPAQLGVDHFAHPYLEGLEVNAGSGWRTVPRRGQSWFAPECHERGCRLRYRYHLAHAAAAIDRFGFAAYRGGALLAPPSTWLLHPRAYEGSDRYRFSVATAPGESFVSGVMRAPGGRGQYEAPAELLFEAPYSAFGRFRTEELEESGGKIRLSLSLGAGELSVSFDALRAATRAAAGHVRDYFGRFPLREVAVLVLPVPGSDLLGMQLGNGGATILFFVGKRSSEAALARDWVLTHEMFHLAFPTLSRRHLWLAEGLATYQEPIARVRAGRIGAPELWEEFLTGMPKGLPGPGDGGLDGSGSWGRIYWGGALFCLLADVAIRVESENRLSLDVAMRAVLAAGGDAAVRWTLLDVLAAADRALGTRTLSELYAAHGSTAANVDLEALWRKLGVSFAGGRVVFDDGAPWAFVRRAIAEAPGAPSAVQGAQSGFGAPGVPKSAL